MIGVIWLYRFLFIPAFLLLLPYYLIRMVRRGGYLRDFKQRIGFAPCLGRSEGRRVWIQAVSVGEVLAVEPLVDGLIGLGYEIVLTTTTSTGYKLARKKYDSKVRFTGLFQLDFLPIVRSSWKRLRPDICLLMESELWPEHLWQAHQRKVPIILVNARMSDRSFKRAKLVKFAYAPLLQSLAGLMASGQQDLDRYLDLGIDPEKAQLTGNLKIDVELSPVIDAERKAKLMDEIGFSKNIPVILGSSTWAGEELALTEVTQQLILAGIQCHLLLVPRHAERRGEIRKQLEGQSLSWHFRSDSLSPPITTTIYVADTTGELVKFTQISSVAFIGKTLSPNKGSQTPIEAAALGIPTIFGPATNNFRIICEELEEAEASVRVQDIDTLFEVLKALLDDTDRLNNMSRAATNWHKANLGASERTLEFIKNLTPTPS